MTNETEKLRAELKQFVSDCKDEALLKEMLRVAELQTELKWIQTELETVKDPTFIKAIKSMLKYRKEVLKSKRIE